MRGAPCHQAVWLGCVGECETCDAPQLCAEHEALDPEYSILKQRLARRMRHDGLTDADLPDMDLVAITKVGHPNICILSCWRLIQLEKTRCNRQI